MKKVKIKNFDGEVLTATEFAPVESNEQVVLIGSATGVRQQFYYNFAAFLAGHGFYVYTFDYCGIGLSKTTALKKCSATYRSWAQIDFPAIIKHLKDTHPNKKRYLIGHSFGGNCLGLANIGGEFESIVTIASQHGYWKNFPKNRQTQMWLLFRVVMPILSWLCGYFPSRKLGLGEDIPRGVALDWSKIILRKNSFLALTRGAKNYYSEIDCQMLMISVEDDWMACQKAVDALAATVFSNAQITRQHLVPSEVGATRIGHLDFFRKKFEPTLWQIPLAWLRQN